mgnify:CR=1 FL=1
MYETFEKWLNDTLSQTLPANLEAFCFNIYDDGDNTWSVEVVGCSSDHTIVDVTDSSRTLHSGDTLTFQVRYANMLYAFSGNHVDIAYREAD